MWDLISHCLLINNPRMVSTFFVMLWTTDQSFFEGNKSSYLTGFYFTNCPFKIWEKTEKMYSWNNWNFWIVMVKLLSYKTYTSVIKLKSCCCKGENKMMRHSPELAWIDPELWHALSIFFFLSHWFHMLVSKHNTYSTFATLCAWLIHNPSTMPCNMSDQWQQHDPVGNKGYEVWQQRAHRSPSSCLVLQAKESQTEEWKSDPHIDFGRGEICWAPLGS